MPPPSGHELFDKYYEPDSSKHWPLTPNPECTEMLRWMDEHKVEVRFNRNGDTTSTTLVKPVGFQVPEEVSTKIKDYKPVLLWLDIFEDTKVI